MMTWLRLDLWACVLALAFATLGCGESSGGENRRDGGAGDDGTGGSDGTGGTDWADNGKGNAVADKGDREYAALTEPDDLLVIAAGGPAGGFGAVIPPWLGAKSQAVTVPVGACVDC